MNKLKISWYAPYKCWICHHPMNMHQYAGYGDTPEAAYGQYCMRNEVMSFLQGA